MIINIFQKNSILILLFSLPIIHFYAFIVGYRLGHYIKCNPLMPNCIDYSTMASFYPEAYFIRFSCIICALLFCTLPYKIKKYSIKYNLKYFVNFIQLPFFISIFLFISLFSLSNYFISFIHIFSSLLFFIINLIFSCYVSYLLKNLILKLISFFQLLLILPSFIILILNYKVLFGFNIFAVNSFNGYFFSFFEWYIIIAIYLWYFVLFSLLNKNIAFSLKNI